MLRSITCLYAALLLTHATFVRAAPPGAPAAVQPGALNEAGSTWSIQPGFAASSYARQFADWQDAFSRDLSDIYSALQEASPLRAAIDTVMEGGEGGEAALAQLFPNSIADTPKGRSLKRYLLESWNKERADWRKPPATIFIRQVLDNRYLEPGQAKTRAVGYGGKVTIDGYQTESLYILPRQMDSLRPGSKDRAKRFEIALKALGDVKLPPYGVSARNAWPMLLFVRSARGELMLFAMTQEMSTITMSLYQQQTIADDS